MRSWIASGAEPESTAAADAIGAIAQLLRDVDQRRTLRSLGLADEAPIEQLVADALDDAAIRNSLRLPRRPKDGRSWRPSPAEPSLTHRP